MARKLASNKAVLDRFRATVEEAKALARKGRSKPDAAAAAHVRRLRKEAVAREGEWLPTTEYTPAELRAIITEARQSAARECGEIAESNVYGFGAAIEIRERFNLEGK